MVPMVPMVLYTTLPRYVICLTSAPSYFSQPASTYAKGVLGNKGSKQQRNSPNPGGVERPKGLETDRLPIVEQSNATRRFEEREKN